MKILVAEDSLTMRQLVVKTLERWGYDVVATEDGKQAWERFQQDPFSLVLTDWMMPEMDGIELIQRIRSTNLPNYVYIILLTARGEKEDLVKAMDVGADDFLAKPFDQGELRVRLREGERIIQLERKLADQNRELRETQAALVQSEKLASVGQLAAGMAHEINNPIAYVANNLVVLKRDVLAVIEILEKYREGKAALAAGEPQLADSIVELEEECDLPWVQENLPRLFQASLEGLTRVRDIVKNLRDFAHLDEAELDELDANAAVRSTVEVLRHEIDEKQIVVETQFDQLSPILCQPAKIMQVLHNLLRNAIQASDSQGTVVLRTKQYQDAVDIEVEDNGCGIEVKHLPRIFEPFFTTKPVGQGSGLGLSISYGIVRDHGGSIEVESDAGRGSLFRVRLPLKPPRKE